MQEITKKIELLQSTCKDEMKILAFHFIFNYEVYLSDIETDFGKLDIERTRKKIGIIFLQQKYKAIVLNLADLIIEFDINKDISYQNLFIKYVKKIVTDYEAGFLAELKLLFGSYHGQRIFNIVYYGDGSNNILTQGFETLHKRNIRGIKIIIKAQAQSRLSYVFRLTSFLENCFLAFKNAYYDIEDRLENIDGPLTSSIEQANSNL